MVDCFSFFLFSFFSFFFFVLEITANVIVARWLKNNFVYPPTGELISSKYKNFSWPARAHERVQLYKHQLRRRILLFIWTVNKQAIIFFGILEFTAVSMFLHEAEKFEERTRLTKKTTGLNPRVETWSILQYYMNDNANSFLLSPHINMLCAFQRCSRSGPTCLETWIHTCWK